MKLAFVLTSCSTALASTYPRVYYANTSTAEQSATSYRELTSLVLSSTHSDGLVSTFVSEAFVSLTTLTTNDVVTVVTTWCPLGSEIVNSQLSSYSEEPRASSSDLNALITTSPTSVFIDMRGTTETIQKGQIHTKEVTTCPTCSVRPASASTVPESTDIVSSSVALSVSYSKDLVSQASSSLFSSAKSSSARMPSVTTSGVIGTSTVDTGNLSPSSSFNSYQSGSSSGETHATTSQNTLSSVSGLSKSAYSPGSSSFDVRPVLTTETVDGKTTVYTTWCPLTSHSISSLSSVVTSDSPSSFSSARTASSESQVLDENEHASGFSTRASSLREHGYSPYSMVTITSTSLRTVVYSTEICSSRRCSPSLTSVLESIVFTTSVHPTGLGSSSERFRNTHSNSKTDSILKGQLCSLTSCQETSTSDTSGTGSGLKPTSVPQSATSEAAESSKLSSEGYQSSASSKSFATSQSCILCASQRNYYTTESETYSSKKASSTSAESSQKLSLSSFSSVPDSPVSLSLLSTYSIITTTSNGVVTVYTTWCPFSNLKPSSNNGLVSSSLALKIVSTEQSGTKKPSSTQQYRSLSKTASSFMTLGSGALTFSTPSVTNSKPISGSTLASSTQRSSVETHNFIQRSSFSASHFSSPVATSHSISGPIDTVRPGSSTSLPTSSAISTKHLLNTRYSSILEGSNSQLQKTSASSLISVLFSSSRSVPVVSTANSKNEETSCTQCQTSSHTTFSTKISFIASLSVPSQSQDLKTSVRSSTSLKSSVTYSSKVITTTSSGIRTVYTTYCPWTPSASQESQNSEKQKSSAASSSASSSTSSSASSSTSSSASSQQDLSSSVASTSESQKHQTSSSLDSEPQKSSKATIQSVGSQVSSSKTWTSKVVTTTEGGVTTIYTTWCPLEDLHSSGTVAAVSLPSKFTDSTYISSTSSPSGLSSVPSINKGKTASSALKSSEIAKTLSDSSTKELTSYGTSNSMKASEAGSSDSMSSTIIPRMTTAESSAIIQSTQDASKKSSKGTVSTGRPSTSNVERSSSTTPGTTEWLVSSSHTFSSTKSPPVSPHSSAIISTKATIYSSSFTISVTTVLPFTKTSTGDNGQLFTVVSSQTSIIPTVTTVLVKTRVPVTTYSQVSITESASQQATRKSSTEDTTSSWIIASTVSTYEGSAASTRRFDRILKVATALLLTFIM